MKGLSLIAIIILSLSSFSLFGYGYKVRGLQLWQPERKCYHYWFGIKDYHDNKHRANVPQRRKIEECLLLYNPDDLMVIVEDLSSPNDEGRLGCGSFYINSRVGILAGLGNFCKTNHIPVQNVEYRYCRVICLGPVINNIGADPSLFPSTKKVTVAHVIQEIEQAYQDLLLGNQIPAFRMLLEEKFAIINREMIKLKLMPDDKRAVADYLLCISTPLNRINVVKNLLTFDGILIGFKITDASLRSSHKNKTLVFAGGTHIDEAYELLQKIGGYEPITPIDVSALKVPSIARSIGADATENGLLLKPEPLSLELLEHYLRN
jgi:hypothetical protein